MQSARFHGFSAGAVDCECSLTIRSGGEHSRIDIAPFVSHFPIRGDPSLWLSLCNERRRRHSINAARVEIVRASFVHEVDDDAINTTARRSVHPRHGRLPG